MRFLLTNDDGVDAAGLAALHLMAARLGDPVVVAPAGCHSGCSHKVTTNESFRVHRRSDACHVVEGTPADCVRVGILGLIPDIDWVFSGINHGGNLGADVHLSGTVAAAREGVLLGRPAIAFSHYHRRGKDLLDWNRTARWLVPVVQGILAEPWSPGVFWNINVPHLPADAPDPEVVRCHVDPSPLAVSFRREGDVWTYDSNYHERPRVPGADVDVCFSGNIAVSRLTLPGIP